jgi:acetolactate synthase regulatory subunit
MSERRALVVRLRRTEGALLRLIGLVQRRGFEIADIATAPAEAGVWRVRLDLESARDPVPLARQIEKLYDVVAVDAVGLDEGLDKSILDLPAHAESGAGPDSASTNRALACSIRGPAVPGRQTP